MKVLAARTAVATDGGGLAADAAACESRAARESCAADAAARERLAATVAARESLAAAVAASERPAAAVAAVKDRAAAVRRSVDRGATPGVTMIHVIVEAVLNLVTVYIGGTGADVVGVENHVVWIGGQVDLKII